MFSTVRTPTLISRVVVGAVLAAWLSFALAGCSLLTNPDFAHGCDGNNSNPPNSHDVVVEVPANVTPVPICDWECDDGYHIGYGGACDADCTSGSCGTNGTCDAASGQCVYASCYHLRQAESDVVDGAWPIQDATGGPTPMYCAGGWTYDPSGLGFADHIDDLSPELWGLDQLRALDLSVASGQQAFLWQYANSGGLANLMPGWSGGECCFKSVYDGANDILVGGLPLEPANSSDLALNCGGPYNDDPMLVHHASTTANPPAANFFSSGVEAGAGCAEDHNPAFLTMRFTGLSSCKEILDAGLSIGDGLYLVDPDGATGTVDHVEVVCDMTNGGITYWEYAFGKSSSDHSASGWERVSSAMFTDPVARLAWLWHFGRVGLFTNLEVGFVGECCFATDASYLTINGANVRAAPVGGGAAICSRWDEAEVGVILSDSATALTGPLPRNFITATGSSNVSTCNSTAASPAFFVRRSLP